ncbi:MAG: hypothetical protein IJ604_07300 [Prevotella sp.]|nr:hypothetical protein [Prevotella sp.]
MKRFVLLAVLVSALPIAMMAQDDLYFTPKKSVKKAASTYEKIDDSPVYHSGSNRNVDEYNRRGKFGSYFQKIGTDSLGNDIIEFHSSKEDITDTMAVYPGTKVQFDEEDDYAYSRRLSRFDDYYWYDPWFYSYYGFGPYWRARYYGWYDPWYDPWYYGGWYGSWYGWYDPWFYGHYGWGYPYRYWGWGGYYNSWYTPSYYVSYGNGVTGTRNHGLVTRGSTTTPRGNFGGYRGNGQTTRAYNQSEANSTRRGTFGGNRSSSNSGTRTYSPSTTSSPSYGGGSFGGSRSSGGSFGGSSGGSRSGGGGGGGHFGGRR